jgi:prevent-host-death family protein
MAQTVNVHEAKTHLSRLLARVSAGEEFVIAKAGRAVARLVPVHSKSRERIPGLDKGKIWIAPDFDAPLPPEVLSEFYR